MGCREAIFVDLLHLQRLVSLQISLFPSMQVLALIGTAERDKKCEVISTLRLSNLVFFERNPKRENMFYASHGSAAWEKTNEMNFYTQLSLSWNKKI